MTDFKIAAPWMSAELVGWRHAVEAEFPLSAISAPDVMRTSEPEMKTSGTLVQQAKRVMRDAEMPNRCPALFTYTFRCL
jgi:hypothetical protein